MAKALTIRNLTKTYANGLQALKGVSLDVDEGDFFALLGPNGAGKSTAIGIISSLGYLRDAKATAALIPLLNSILDEAAEQGIETTLIILASRLKPHITVVKRYGELPPVPVYVDELNQVWTNLIANAADASGGRGEVVIESEALDDEVVVRIVDRGEGNPLFLTELADATEGDELPDSLMDRSLMARAMPQE